MFSCLAMDDMIRVCTYIRPIDTEHSSISRDTLLCSVSMDTNFTRRNYTPDSIVLEFNPVKISKWRLSWERSAQRL